MNAAWCQGTGPGYWPKAGTGLTLNLTAGAAFAEGALVLYAGGTLAMADNTTNYVFLDPTAGWVPASNTSGFTARMIPICVVVTLGGVITDVPYDRSFFLAPELDGFRFTGAAPSNGQFPAYQSSDGLLHWTSPAAGLNFAEEEVPGGATSGTDGTDGNATFTLAHIPNPTASLNLFKNGQRMTRGTAFTLAGLTITFLSPYIPLSGADLVANYRY